MRTNDEIVVAAAPSGGREAGAERGGSTRAPRRPQLVRAAAHARAGKPVKLRRYLLARAFGSDPIATAKAALQHRERFSQADFAAVVFRGFFAASCASVGLGLNEALSQLARKRAASPNKQWRIAAQARRRAIFLARRLVGISLADLARATALSTATVSTGYASVEQTICDPQVAAALNSAALQVTGHPALDLPLNLLQALAESSEPIARARTALERPDWLSDVEMARVVCAGFVAAVCECMGLTTDAVLLQLARKGENTFDVDWLAASLARQRGAYLANTAANIKQAEIARAIGVTPAAVCIACRKVEASRDNGAIDALLDAATKLVLGSGDRGPKPSLEEFLQSAIRS